MQTFLEKPATVVGKKHEKTMCFTAQVCCTLHSCKLLSHQTHLSSRCHGRALDDSSQLSSLPPFHPRLIISAHSLSCAQNASTLRVLQFSLTCTRLHRNHFATDHIATGPVRCVVLPRTVWHAEANKEKGEKNVITDISNRRLAARCEKGSDRRFWPYHFPSPISLPDNGASRK